MRKINLQLFAAPDNMTGRAQIMTKAREIDFVTSFGKNIQALLDIMRISRMIEKPNGSVLKVKKAKGVLESGDVGEGEEIPMSRYTVEEEHFDTIKIEKYRKGVSLEAIADKGYEAAIEMTDEEFKMDLQNKITDKFYSCLKMGSLTAHKDTWQAAYSEAIAIVKDKFNKMRRNVTGIVVWVNVKDLYDHLGSQAITIQTAFGLDYIENFMGADVTIVTSEIPQKTIIATPLNNLVAYYVNPGNSEFAQAGLDYTTDPTTGFLGFHAQGTYERAISDMFAIMGVRIFAEYLDAIAYISVGSSDTQTLRNLTLTSAAGTETGKTIATVNPGLSSINNKWKYKTKNGSAEDVTYGMDVKTWSRWDGESEIPVTNGDYLTIVEADQNYKAVAKGDIVAVSKG